MPGSYLIVFELLISSLFALCMAHALKHGAHHVVRLLSGAVFGLLLELMTIWQLQAYHYGRFLLMIFSVPLCIAIAWGIILYSAMEFSDSTSLPRWARPLMDGLLALNLDLALDVVAIRLGFWDWGQGPSFQFFGVPFANYLAWFWVASSFSAGYRLLANRRSRWLSWMAGPFGVLFGLIFVLATNAFMAFVIPIYNHLYLVILVPLLAMVLVISQQPRLHARQAPLVASLVPLLSFAYVLAAGFASNIFQQSPDLLALTLAMLFILLSLHWMGLKYFLIIRPGMRQSHSH